MYLLTINGAVYPAAVDKNLLDFLRDDVHITSLKNGCGEGACGACMILVDHKAMRACLLTASKVVGKEIVTVEGLTELERDIFVWAFTKAGAVQCGFCIPGMVISAKALLDKTFTPSENEIRKAIRGNICRCTGYVKIVEAIVLAAQAFRGEVTTSLSETGSGVGACLPRLDAKEKILGTGQYVDDMHVPGMLWAAVLRAPCARAKILNIDVKAAKALPGVEAVMTAQDVPGERLWGFIFKDWPALVAMGEETRYIGDALALVAATSKEIARQALGLIAVEFEELPPVEKPVDALQENAVQIDPNGNLLKTIHVKRGDTQKAIAESMYQVTQHYSTPPTEHAFMEPESALAVPVDDGKITIYVGTQSIYEDQHGIMSILGLPQDQVRVISKLVGGAFGGKEDLSVQHHAALLAQKTQKPVKLTLTRQESILVHPKRHAMEFDITTACDAQGKITAISAQIIADTGAYSSLGTPVVQRACTHLAGPYQVPNVDIKGLCVYTNNPPAGAFRGFGVTQATFASELNLDMLAEKVGISPWEIRYRNALEPGMVNATGQIVDEGTAIKETLLAVREIYESHPQAGIACAMKNTGIGVGMKDISRVNLKIEQGKVLVLTSAACIGQGLATIVAQMVAETTGLEHPCIEVSAPDTSRTPDAGTTTASRQTMFTGEATRQAALQLQQALQATSLDELEGQEFYGEYFGETDAMSSDKANPVSHVAYSYATQVVLLNTAGRVEKVIAAHDVGKAINPQAIEGQIEGAIAMGLGYALQEDFPLEHGVPQVKYGTLGLFRATDMPEIQVILIEKNPSPLAYGAKGIGEIATIPVAPAVASAYYRLDGKFRSRLPLRGTPYRK